MAPAAPACNAVSTCESLPENIRIACIGPVTEAAARQQGFTVHIFQETFTIPGMVKALVEYFSGNQSQRE
jgi:uroporphyrinogen III methyltransferase/synthase